MKKLLIRVVLLAIVGAIAWGGYTALKQIPQSRVAQMPTTKVRRSDVVVRTFARGEMRAVRSETLVAPNLFGTVQVTKIAPLGSFAKEKDLIVEFDDSELLSRIEEKQLELDQVDEQIKKAQADLAIRDNQDKVELLRAQYSVRRAELEVKRNPLLGDIDQKKNLLNQDEAVKRLKQLESDIKSRQQQAQAELAVLRERKNKANLEMVRERTRLMQVKLLAPISGLVAIRQNRAGGFFVSGMSLPDIREGDQLSPGIQVADVLDLSEVEVVARIGELDRANLREGQEVVITLDALAEKRLRGQIKAMSGTASSNIFSNDPAKKFDVVFSVDMKELMTHLGAKPEQIARVLTQAEANRKKPATSAPMAFGGGGFPGAMPGGMPGGPGGPVVMMAGPGGGAPGAPGGGVGFRMGGPAGDGGTVRGRAGGEGGAASMSPEQMQKMREIMQKVTGGRNMREMEPEQRQAMMQKVQEELKKAGINAPAGFGRGGRGGRGGEGAGEGGERQARGEGRGGRGGEGGGRGGRGGEGGANFAMGFGSSQRFTPADLENAKLPPPPEENSQLEVLLRPGLLADIQIIVEKIPNAINIPAQAVFDIGDGKSTVYVKEGNRFVARTIQPLKRSENTMVVAEGLKAGEEIALSNPEAKPGSKKGGDAQKGGGSGAPMMPAGKG